MRDSDKKELVQTMQKAAGYLDSLTETGDEPDFQLVHSYIYFLTPYLHAPRKPSDVVRIMIRLYLASERYQEAAVLLQRLNNPALNSMRVRCDAHSAYYAPHWCWLARQDKIQEIFSSALPSLTEETFPTLLTDPLDHCFPTDLLDIAPLDGDFKGLILLGNPDGIYSLFPMNYLIQHLREEISAGWNVLLDSPDVAITKCELNGEMVKAEDIAVRITPSSGFHVGPKVDLALWHPALCAVARSDGEKAVSLLVRRLVNASLSSTISTLYVGSVSVADRSFQDTNNTASLCDLQSWFQTHDLGPAVSMSRLLPNRVYAFTREPVMVSRPRGDILRGETCMPELEEIYFLRNGKGLAALQRYGVGCWFLIIPKTVCGDHFPAFRDALMEGVREEEDAVCFTGWAEGTRNYYLDLLSLSGDGTLYALEGYCENLPGGKEIRISSFYWNSTPRTLRCMQELQKLEKLDQMNPDEVAPPKEQVSAKSRAKLEKAFRETRWEKTDRAPDWDITVVSPYDVSLDLLDETLTYINSCKEDEWDYGRVHQALRQALPKDDDDASDASEMFCNRLAEVLASNYRYQESIKWRSRTISGTQLAHLYSCCVASSYPRMPFQWEARRQRFWQQFAAAESDLVQALSGNSDSDALSRFQEQADVLFPTEELRLSGGKEGRKNTLITGLPGGMLTLPAMLYFTSHYPANIGKRWNIAISGEEAPPQEICLLDQPIPLQDIQAALTEKDGGVSLSLWHPMLLLHAVGDPAGGIQIALQLVRSILPLGTRLLFVTVIGVASKKPEKSFPLPELRQRMRDMGYPLDVPLDTLLSRRRYAITRQPKETGRPRDDIIRGETCMPELERIYNRLYEEGQIILERHGIAALFLMIPNQLCGGDPAQYRQQLQRYLTHAEGDQVFFTGWAEGTRYTYLDLITMDGRSLLDKMNEYALSNPDGEDLRYSTFFWNAIPLPWDRSEAADQLVPDDEDRYEAFARTHLPAEFPVPDAETAAALMASFHSEFTKEDFCAPKPAAAPEPAVQKPVFGKKKLSKAQRKAQNSKNSQNGKKKR